MTADKLHHIGTKPCLELQDDGLLAGSTFRDARLTDPQSNPPAETLH